MEQPKANSPLEISVLLHYHCSPGNPPNFNAPGVQEAIYKFCNLGLMKRNGETIETNADALQCYINKLIAVELPRQVWI